MGCKVRDQVNFLIQAFNLIAASGIHPETPLKEWIPTLLFLHKKKWLWGAYEKDTLACVGAVYKTNEFDGKYPEHFPEDEPEDGKMAYVSFLVSFAKDKMLPKKMLSAYLKRNPSVEELIFFDNDLNVKRFKIIAKEKAHEEALQRG